VILTDALGIELASDAGCLINIEPETIVEIHC
jgi:hypothetical protein